MLQTRLPNLSRIMRHVNGVYTQAYNRRHGVVGHLFQGRFKAVVVDGDEYFLEVCRYVDLNPVRAGLVKRPEEWAWSSYRAHTNKVDGPSWLDSETLHRQLSPGAFRRHGPERYENFVAQGRGVKLWEEALKGQIYLDGDAFVQRMQSLIAEPDEKEVPRAQRRSTALPLQRYFDLHERDAAIALAFTEGGYTQTAIAEKTGLSISQSVA